MGTFDNTELRSRAKAKDILRHLRQRSWSSRTRNFFFEVSRLSCMKKKRRKEKKSKQRKVEDTSSTPMFSTGDFLRKSSEIRSIFWPSHCIALPNVNYTYFSLYIYKQVRVLSSNKSWLVWNMSLNATSHHDPFTYLLMKYYLQNIF